MKKRWLVVFSMLCLLFAVVFAGCGEKPTPEPTPVETYTVSVAVNKSDYGSVSKKNIRNVALGTEISIDGNKLTIGETEITATPAADADKYTYSFVEWSWNETNWVTKDLTITAVFERTERVFTVTIISNNPEYGTVGLETVENVPYGTLIVPKGNLLSIGDIAVVTALVQPKDSGYTYTFVDWTAVTTVKDNVTITANFAKSVTTYTVSVLSNDESCGTVDIAMVENILTGTAIIVSGNTVTIGNTIVTATPNADSLNFQYAFDSWDTVETVTGDITITANFTKTYIGSLTANELQALESLVDGENHYWYYWHGAVNGLTFDGEKIVWTVAQNGNGVYGGGVGTTLLPSVIQELYGLGFKKLTFTLGMESGLYCAIFFDNDTGLDYLSGTTVAKDENNYYFFENGTEITIDLEALVKNATFMNTACAVDKGGLHFVVFTNAEFVAENVYKSATTITLSGLALTELSEDEQQAQGAVEALNILMSSDSHYWYYFHGAVADFELKGNTLIWTVGQNGNAAYGGGSGTTLKPSTIQALYNLGFKKLTFTLGMESGLYCAIFFDNDTGLDYLSGTTVAKDENNYYFFENGTEITVDLEALVKNATFMNTACAVDKGGLHFVVFTIAEFVAENVYKSATTITLGETVWTKLSEEEMQGQRLTQALNVLTNSDNHYWYYFHGAAQDFAVDGTTVTWKVAQNGNGVYGGGVGTTLKPSTIKALYDLGFKKLTFTLGLENGLYCAIYIDNDTGLNYLSGTTTAKDADNHYFFENGTEITIDLEVLVNDATFMNTACAVDKGGLHFVVLSGAEFVAENVYKSATTIVLAIKQDD